MRVVLSLTLSIEYNHWKGKTFWRWTHHGDRPTSEDNLHGWIPYNNLYLKEFKLVRLTRPCRTRRWQPISSRWSCDWIWNWRHFTKTGFKFLTGPASSWRARFPERFFEKLKTLLNLLISIKIFKWNYLHVFPFVQLPCNNDKGEK